MKIILTVLIGICQVSMALIPLFSKKLIDRRRNGHKQVTAWGYVVILSAGASIVAAILLFMISEKEQNEATKKLVEEITNSKVVLADKLDSSNKVTNQILAENYLRLDSTNDRLVKIIKDSAKTTVLNSPDPVLRVDNLTVDSIDTNSYRISITVSCRDANCRLDSFNELLLVQYTNTGSIFKAGEVNTRKLLKAFAKNETVTYYIITSPKWEPVFIYYYWWGKYYNYDRTKTYPISEVTYYNLRGKSFGLIHGETRNKIIDIANSK